EGFADLFAVAIEHTYKPHRFNNWEMGEEVSYSHQGVRSLNSPTIPPFYNPDAYLSPLWLNDLFIDKGGIHTNCTVLGKWFNLLCEGGSNINEFHNQYDVKS